MFSLREGLNLEMSKLSWIKSSKLEEEIGRKAKLVSPKYNQCSTALTRVFI